MRLQESLASASIQRIPAISTTPRSFLAAILSFACLFSLTLELPASAAIPAAAKDKKPKIDPALKGLPITELNADEAILHALNRLAYGPRPGDVERVRQMGLGKWIALDARLADYPTLRMSTAKLIDEYPQPKPAEKQAEKQAQARAQQEQRRSDAAAAVVEKDLQSVQGQPANSEVPAATSVSALQPPSDNPNAPAPMKQQAPGNTATNGAGRRDVLGGGDPNNVPRAIADDSKRPQRVVAELGMAKVTRAIYSERQLQQVMDDFWFNHFNVFAGKGEDRYYLTSYERDVIQPRKIQGLGDRDSQEPGDAFLFGQFSERRSASRRASGHGARLAPTGALRKIRKALAAASSGESAAGEEKRAWPE